MWYNSNKLKELDYNKPIMCEQGDFKQILLPQMNRTNAYIITGYNWFNLEEGTYSSACFFKTAKEAVDSRNGYIIYNVEISTCKFL